MTPIFTRTLEHHPKSEYLPPHSDSDWKLICSIGHKIEAKLGEDSSWHVFLHGTSQLDPKEVAENTPTFSHLSPDWIVTKYSVRGPDVAIPGETMVGYNEGHIFAAYNLKTADIRFAPDSEAMLRSVPNGYPGPRPAGPSLFDRIVDVFA